LDHKLITDVVLELMQENQRSSKNNESNDKLKISKQAIHLMHSVLERHVIFIFEIAEKITDKATINFKNLASVHEIAKNFEE